MSTHRDTVTMESTLATEPAALARILYKDDRGTHTFLVTKNEVVIGRQAPDVWADLSIDTSLDVSREHARLQRTPEGGFRIKDLSKLGTTVNGKMYAIPLFTDSGMLFYRTDLLQKYKIAPPTTWLDLVSAAQKVMAHEPSVPYGILWQGAQYEGLFCDVCELFWTNGGNVLQNFSGNKVVIDSPNNRWALQFMVDTIYKYKIAPRAVTTYMEEDTRHLWENGKSVFIRQWPYVWSLGNLSTSKIHGKFQLKPLPHGPHGKPAAALGGWNLAISARSRNPDAAAKLALYLTSFESQKYQSIKASLNPALSSVYHDPDALKVNPWYRNFYEVVRNALPRPVSKDETKISDRVTRQVEAALKGQISVATALKNAQRDVEQIVGGANTTP